MEHAHLDRARRDPGECPACDEEWERQRLRLSKDGRRERAYRSLDSLVKRESEVAARRYGKRPRE